MDLVDEELRACFRLLVAGKAPWPLYLYGHVGTGKTRAALCLCDFAAHADYWTVEELMDLEMNGDAESKRKSRERLSGSALIVVDEIGERERVGDLYATTLKRVMEARETYQDRRAIYISNVFPDDLKELFDERIESRLLCGTRFHLDGSDRRNRP